MKDRFKFRAWEIDKKKYHYDVQDWYEFFVIDYPEKYIVEQCTGLKDKNGKLIYEGDIVRDVTNGKWYNIIWHEVNGCWFLEDCASVEYCFLPHEFEVIGNIHENAELMI